MTIRDLTLADFPQFNKLMLDMARIHANGRPDIFKNITRTIGGTKAWGFEYSLSAKNISLFCAEHNHEIIGICSMTVKPAIQQNSLMSRHVAFINELYVAEAHRLHGIGTALYKEAVRRAQKQGVDYMELSVWDFNETAKSFYRSLGMKVQKSIMEQKIGG